MKTDLKAELEKVLSLVSKDDQKNKQTRIQRQWLSQNMSAACSKYTLKFKPKSVMSLCYVIYIGCKGWNTLPDRSPGFTYIATNCFVFTS